LVQDVKPLGNGAAPALLPDTTELEQLAQSRLQQLERLRADHVALQQEHDRLKQLVSGQSDELRSLAELFCRHITPLKRLCANHHSSRSTCTNCRPTPIAPTTFRHLSKPPKPTSTSCGRAIKISGTPSTLRPRRRAMRCGSRLPSRTRTSLG
jgi:hypothetical protein